MAEDEKPGLVIFDCDGVLVDSEPIAARVLADELGRAGFDVSPAGCIARYTGISMPGILARVEEEWGRPLPEDFAERVRERDAAAFHRELRPIAGAREMLAALGRPRCVASSGSLAKMRANLAITGLSPLLEPHLFSAEMVAHGKPAPDLFLLAASRMEFPHEACVVVEDAPAGIAAGVAAGMRAIGFVGGSHCTAESAAALRDAGAYAIFARMEQLPQLLAAPDQPASGAAPDQPAGGAAPRPASRRNGYSTSAS